MVIITNGFGFEFEKISYDTDREHFEILKNPFFDAVSPEWKFKVCLSRCGACKNLKFRDLCPNRTCRVYTPQMRRAIINAIEEVQNIRIESPDKIPCMKALTVSLCGIIMVDMENQPKPNLVGSHIDLTKVLLSNSRYEWLCDDEVSERLTTSSDEAITISSDESNDTVPEPVPESEASL